MVCHRIGLYTTNGLDQLPLRSHIIDGICNADRPQAIQMANCDVLATEDVQVAVVGEGAVISSSVWLFACKPVNPPVSFVFRLVFELTRWRRLAHFICMN